MMFMVKRLVKMLVTLLAMFALIASLAGCATEWSKGEGALLEIRLFTHSASIRGAAGNQAANTLAGQPNHMVYKEANGSQPHPQRQATYGGAR